MLKRMLTVATVVALAGGLAGCADRDQGAEDGGGGGEEYIQPDRDGEDGDDEDGRRERVAPRDD